MTPTGWASLSLEVTAEFGGCKGLKRVQSMVVWLQGRNSTVEGPGRGELLTPKKPGSRAGEEQYWTSMHPARSHPRDSSLPSSPISNSTSSYGFITRSIHR